MATPASQVSIPAPIDADFINGESAVAISGSPGSMVTRYFAREFRADRSGLYLLKLWISGGGTVRIGRDLATLQVLLTAPADETIQTQVYLQKGVNRIDVQADSDQIGFFAMTIYHPDQINYASSAAGWVFNASSAPSDAEVPDALDAALPVFSILPNWGDGITERVSYLTDILTSESATEQPRLLRLYPRREFDADFLRKGTLRSRLDNFLTGIGRRKFWMPLWHEQHRVAAALSPAGAFVQFPAGTLALREFQVGDKVFVNNGDPDDFEVLAVGSLDYDLGRLYWSSNPTRDWPVGTRVIPMRRARITEQAQLQAPVDTVARGGLRFELVDPEYRFGAAWGHCAPVWLFPVNRADNITFTYDHLAYVLDNSVAPSEYTSPSKRALLAMRFAVLLRGRAMTVAFRRFIDMAGGRAGRFYMPTGMTDIEPATDTLVGVNLDAKPQGFTDYLQYAQDSRSIIAILFSDGSPTLYRRVVDVQRVGNVERFVLDLALPSIGYSTIKRVQYMLASRFDQDTFEFNHLVDESAAVRTNVVTRSVESGGMPDINCP